AGGLAILFPNWMRHNVHVNTAKFARLAEKVFGVEVTDKTVEQIALEGIEALSAFWTSIGAPNKLADYNIDATYFDDMVQHSMVNGPFGNFIKLQSEDVKKILEMSL
ncbi:MAG: iron-containing alcohol dehydrogenase, partial [Solibacillus sp.]